VRHFNTETKHYGPFNSNLMLQSLAVRTFILYAREYSGPRNWNNLKTSCYFTKIPCAKCTVWVLRFSILKAH